MLIRIPQVLNADAVKDMRSRLSAPDARWVDGRVTAGHQGARVKRNLQIAEDCAAARELADIVLRALEKNPLFISAALPNRVYPPMFNRYEESGEFGRHIDNAVRLVPGTGMKIRTDVSATLFLSAPEEYDGGELVVEDTYGAQSIKLPAGDMVVYPGTSLHKVNAVTRGLRLASFFWVESMVRDDAQRALLYDLDVAIQQLGRAAPGNAALVSAAGCYHNLLRMWAET